MALDVHLTRDVNERWGFELAGGAEIEMPLTVEKLQPSSPASRAGLQNRDTILTINGEEAIDFTHEEAFRKLAECEDTLTIGVVRGLYDPVLDDHEPIYYEPGDLDPESQPTEVSFKVQQFLEPADLGSSLIEYGTSSEPSGTPYDPSVLLTEYRSLTASPFVTPTRLYRPFSTEPIPQIPPLEDPIILNPDYNDQFGESLLDIDPDYILNAHNKDGGFEGKFKLPISEQYDPDGTKQIKNAEVDSILSKYVNMETLSKKTVSTDERISKTHMKDVKVTEKSSKDVKIDGSVTKDRKETLIKEVKSEESLSKDVKERRESMRVIVEDVSVSEEMKKQDISIKKEVKTTEKYEIVTDEMEEEMITEELKRIEKMKQARDMAQIEETALSVVDDSIERAVSVAEEIKKEMEEEHVSETEQKSETLVSKSKKEVMSEKTEQKTVNSDELIEIETSERQSKKMGEEADFEAVQKKVSEELTEDMETKVTRRTSTQDEEISQKVAKKDVKVAFESESKAEQYEERVTKESPKRKVSFTQGVLDTEGKKYKKETKTVTSTTKSGKEGAQQRTYAIGLQTIPNIRGVVHSSYHYDLLLRTFFLHLTDVMVALSRFVLTQPIFNTESQETHESVSETQMYESEVNDVRRTSQQDVGESIEKEKKLKVNEQKMKAETKKEGIVEETKEVIKPVAVQKQKLEIEAVSEKSDKRMKVQEERIERRQLVTPVPEEMQIKSHEKIQKIDVKQEVKTDLKDTKKVKEITQEYKKEEVTRAEEKKAVSGAQMAQRTEQKLTKDMAQKMDAVISEFQTIAVEEDKKEMLQRSRRSRSRSQIEEEVARESDPLEWLDKVDSRRSSQEISQERLSKKEYSSSATFEKKQSETLEKQEIKYRKAKMPKQMYRAVVEAHVYTNKDIIFEDASEYSETSSVQSAEEINTAFEAMETMSSENVVLENAVQQLEQAKIVEESQQFAKVSVQSAATVQKLEDVVHESTELKLEEYKKETAVQSTDIQEVVVQESRDIIEPVVEIIETIKEESVAVNLNESLSVAEATEINVQESKSEFTTVESKKETAVQSADIQEVVIQESREIIEPVVEIKETIKKENVAVNINESLSIAESSEINVQESKSEFISVESKKESAAIIEEDYRESAIVESKAEVLESKIEVVEAKAEVEAKVEVEEVSAKVVVKAEKADYKTAEEYAALKIVKEVETEIESTNEIIEIEEELDVSQNIEQQGLVKKIAMSKALVLGEANVLTEKSFATSEISLAESKTSAVDISTSKHVESHVSDIVQESSFIAKSVDKKLTVRTDLETQLSDKSPPSTIDTPTPSTVPPTPLTDEYVFQLTIPLPKSRDATPIPRDCTLSPEDEDPHIVKKKLIPHIETTIEKVVYDPPLPTPPGDKVQSPIFKTPGLFGGASKPIYKIKFPPVYRKPGLFGGADNPEYSKEEIREIERKSSLLASAIDETIKSIEEYKEEVGMEKKKEVKFAEYKEEKVSKTYQESYSKEIVVESKQNGVEDTQSTTIEEIIDKSNGADNNEDITTKIEEFVEEKASDSSINIEIIKEKEAETQKQNVVTESQNSIQNKSKSEVTKEKVEIQPASVEHAPVEIENSETTITEVKQKENKELESKTSVEIKDASDTALQSKVEISEVKKVEEERIDPLLAVRPVVFDPEGKQKRGTQQNIIMQDPSMQEARQSPYMTESGEIIGTVQGIVDGLEDPVMDAEVAKELGKPGISEEKIATLISGEAEMLREAHVMGLSRVLTSHMHRLDDSSVDFQKIKPMIGSLKDSEVLKALNEDMARQKEEQRKKEEKRWTTFLQKPKRPVPKAKFGYQGWTKDEEEIIAEPYKVKIVKQAKPKVAPDYKPEDFDTGPLPWEQRAELESSLPPVEPEDPILIPELPEYLEAVDPLKESEVPDLEDTGLPLPPPREPTPPPIVEQPPEEEPEQEQQPEVQEVEEHREQEKEETREEMDNRIAEQLVRSVQGMVDPNATIDQQLAQMRAQLAALAQLPEVIQQTLALVSQQLNKMTHQEANVKISASHESQSYQEMEVTQNHVTEQIQENQALENMEAVQNHDAHHEDLRDKVTIEEVQEHMVTGGQQMQQMMQQENRRVLQTPLMTEEDMRMEKMKKEQDHQARQQSEGRQIKQRPTPRAGKPKRVFGPPDPEAMAVVLPGGRRWRNTEDVYNEQKIAEMFQSNSEVIKGNAIGINFMKYEKPPVTLDHLQNSETYKLVHDMDQAPVKRVELLTPVICEADYRERCRSMTPSGEKKHQLIPQQFHP